MQLIVDTHDPLTLYADLREDESLTDDLRGRAIHRARQLGVQYIEFWRPPYGSGADLMSGFIEMACVATQSEPVSEVTNDRPDEGVTEASTQQLSRAGLMAGRNRNHVPR
jgi:hypothetical protein